MIPSADEQLRARTAEAVLAAMRQRSVPRIPPSFVAHSGPARIIDRLGQLDYEARIDREDYESELGLLQGRLARAARSKKFQDRSLVLVFEGQDAAGKGGAIRRVTHALDARQFDITPVAAPNSYELSRLSVALLAPAAAPGPHRHLRPLLVRSRAGRARREAGPPADWRRAYAEINDFEEQLSGSGALVLKFWLAVTPDVQLERFKEREKSPFKNFKITPDDWRNRDKWKEYAAATNEMLTRTDVAHAPWHLISANDKRYARLQVLRHIVEALENPR